MIKCRSARYGFFRVARVLVRADPGRFIVSTLSGSSAAKENWSSICSPCPRSTIARARARTGSSFFTDFACVFGFAGIDGIGFLVTARPCLCRVGVCRPALPVLRQRVCLVDGGQLFKPHGHGFQDITRAACPTADGALAVSEHIRQPAL